MESFTIYGLDVTEFANDQELAQFLIMNNLTNFEINILGLLRGLLVSYSERKEEYDEKLSQAVLFDYRVLDSFEESGNKMPEILSYNSILVDCRYVQRDIVEMIDKLSKIVQESNYLIYSMVEKRLF